ncbi:WD_REPEATS_REGION domain-containing protein, partial [Haematococcus lacustris]
AGLRPFVPLRPRAASQVEPKFLTITNYHVVAASDEAVYVWQFRTSFSKILSTDVSGVKRRDVREKVFHIDDPNPAQVTAEGYKPPPQSTSDSISAMCASDSVLMVGRASGVVQRYSLPHLTVEGQHVLRCRPYMLALNCNTTKMSVIDINGVLSFYDLQVKGQGSTQGEHLSFERKAFIKLESMPTIQASRRDEYGNLAMSIFLKNAPVDPRALKETRERSGPAARVKSITGNQTMDAMLDDLMGQREQVCVA